MGFCDRFVFVDVGFGGMCVFGGFMLLGCRVYVFGAVLCCGSGECEFKGGGEVGSD